MIQIAVRVQPGASSSQVVGWITGPDGFRILKIRLRAPAVEGQANAALIEFLAETFSIRSRQITLLKGNKSREKLVALDGVTMDQVEHLVP